jgi:hypothetical protein
LRFKVKAATADTAAALALQLGSNHINALKRSEQLHLRLVQLLCGSFVGGVDC